MEIDIRNTVSWRICRVLLAWGLNHSVYSTLDGVVAPPCQEVASVDNDGTLNWRRVDKLTSGTLYLQPASAVLEQERDRAVVLC